MKNFLRLIAGLMIFPNVALAGGPYFRLVGKDNYHVYDGALFSAKGGLDATQNTTVLALATHSTADGSILPDSWVKAGYAETWTPFVIGGSEGGGHGTLNFGPLVNVGPQIQQLIFDVLSTVAPDAFPNAKTFLVNNKASGKADITFSAGVMLNCDLVQNGHFVNAKAAFADPVRYFAGPALHF